VERGGGVAFSGGARLRGSALRPQTCHMIRTRHTANPMDGGERSRALVPVLWAGGGFVAGVVFWHLIGFWSIVSGAVLGAHSVPSADTAVVERRDALPPLQETSSIQARAKACIALTIDAKTGETRGAPCPAGRYHHGNSGLGSKDDRAGGGSRWSTFMHLQPKDY